VEAVVSIAVGADGGASEVLSGVFMGLVRRTRMGILPSLALLCSHEICPVCSYKDRFVITSRSQIPCGTFSVSWTPFKYTFFSIHFIFKGEFPPSVQCTVMIGS
jgi:hypothetical protein